MNFFKYFPTTAYNFTTTQGQYALNITNITAHIQIVERLKQVITSYHDYIIQDGDRPDSVANAIYGSPDYTWIVLILNNIFTLYDWPLTTTEFNAYLIDKYGSLQVAQSLPVYKTADGYIVDVVTYAALPAVQQATVQYAYDAETTKNETKRRIRVVPIEFVGPLVIELKRVFV